MSIIVGMLQAKCFALLFAAPSLNDGKSNRSADKSMPVRNSCRQAIARHPVTMVSSARKNSLEYFQSLSEKPLSDNSDI
jgi:hypothetical protein